MNEFEGYRKLSARELDADQQAKLRRALQHDLTEEMVRAVGAGR